MILSSLAVISLVLHFNCILHLVVCALVSLSRDAMTWRVICDCGISRTCHLFFVGGGGVWGSVRKQIIAFKAGAVQRE